MRVLIIEDDTLLGPMLIRALRRRGHETVLCTSIAEGAKQIAECVEVNMPPDVVLCDRELPDGDAWLWSALQNDKLSWSMMRFVYMSGNPTDTERAEHEYFTKGIDDMAKLYRLIEV